MEPGRRASRTARSPRKDCTVAETRKDRRPSIFSALVDRARRKAPPPPVRRILVVDDEEPVRKYVDRVLRDGGYETTVAVDGVDALKVVESAGRFDLLVTDLMMPQLPGDELARRLRQKDPGLKVLYLTGYSDHLFKEKVMLWEGEAYLDKPCSVKGLLQAVSLLGSGRISLIESGS
jgi:two-component system cell cycle sensor histidine kinase/response regulator CckA